MPGILLGMAVFFGPVLPALFALVMFPGTVERWVSSYVGWGFAKFSDLPLLHSFMGDLPGFVNFWRVYSQRVLIKLLADIYNYQLFALLYAGLAAGAVLAVRWAARSLGGGSRYLMAVETFAVLLVLRAFAAPFGLPFPYAAAAVLAFLYLTNILLPVEVGSRRCGEERKPGAFSVLISMSGVLHLFAPSALFGIVLGLSGSPREKNPGRALLLGRAWTLLFLFPAISLFFFSAVEPRLSPAAREVFPQKGLYDIVVDPGANRLLVTFKDGNVGWTFSLDTLKATGRFILPTQELEDIEFDPVRREIYHVDRESGRILAIDADTFKVLRSGRIGVPSSGSTKLAFDPVSNKLLISWENDNLFAADRYSLDSAIIGTPGNVGPVSAGGIAYYNAIEEPGVWALDLVRMRPFGRAEGPKKSDRPALAPSLGELFVPDPYGGRIWVYSAPGLELLRKLPAQFGVRPLAVDETNRLLLSASVVTGYLEVLDLRTGKKAQRHYVGKYPRIIRLDAPRRRAFITLTNSGLYALDY